MTVIFSFLISMIIGVPFILTYIWLMDVATKPSGVPYGYAGYKEFKNQYEKVEWKYDNLWLVNKEAGYLFESCTDRINKYDAYHMFNKKLMIMRDPISNVLMKSFVKRKFKEIELQRTKDSHKKGEGEWR